MPGHLIAEAAEQDFKVAVETRNSISWLKSVSAFANEILRMMDDIERTGAKRNRKYRFETEV